VGSGDGCHEGISILAGDSKVEPPFRRNAKPGKASDILHMVFRIGLEPFAEPFRQRQELLDVQNHRRE